MLDTNVLLSGLFTHGLCEAVFDTCVNSSGVVILTSEHILAEFARNAVDKFHAPGREVEAAVMYLRRHTKIVQPAPIDVNFCQDRSDLPVLGTAVAGRAEAFVTGDAALLALKKVSRARIVSPRVFHDEFIER